MKEPMEMHKVQTAATVLERELLTNEADIDIPWFHPAEFIGVLRKQINVYKNRTTYAVSNKKGVVYFTPNVIYNSFKELADEKDVLYESEPDRARMLIHIVNEMQKYGAIAEESIAPGYFCAMYKVGFKGQEGNVAFIPCRAEIFPGLNLAVSEKEKTTHLKNIEILEPVKAAA